MSRSNPYKLRPSRPHTTVLAVGEGETEGAFLSHLKDLYVVRGSGIQVKVEWAYGGSPGDIISEALRFKKSAAFSKGFLLIDTDLNWPSEEVTQANAHGLILLGSRPCLEGFLLEILDPTTQWKHRSSKDCRTAFHSNVLSQDHKLASSRYGRAFTRDVLEQARKRCSILDTIISHFTVP